MGNYISHDEHGSHWIGPDNWHEYAELITPDPILVQANTGWRAIPYHFFRLIGLKYMASRWSYRIVGG